MRLGRAGRALVLVAVAACLCVAAVALTRGGSRDDLAGRGAHLRGSCRTPGCERSGLHPSTWPVVESHTTLVDRTQPLVLDDQTLATTTTLPTYLWRPNSPDRFPLVVFIHGYDVGPLTYQRFCRRLAQTGFVVAAPAFPLEDPALGFGLSRSDLPEEALDVRFVVRALTHGALARSLLPGAVAVVGHSDGADVALMVGYEEGLRDPQVRAVVADAPDPMTGTVVIGGPPLLLLQGSDDPVVPFSSSQTVFEQVRATTLYLTLVGAGHLGPIQGGTRWTPALDASVRLFLDATLRGAPRARLVTELRELPYVLVRAHR